jgi:hypothetical protein
MAAEEGEAEDYAEVLLTPRRAEIQVTHFGLAWAPFWRGNGADEAGEMRPAYRRVDC